MTRSGILLATWMLLGAINLSVSLDVLVVLTFAIRSMHEIFLDLGIALAQHGHRVVLYSPFPPLKDPPSGLQEISLEDQWGFFDEAVPAIPDQKDLQTGVFRVWSKIVDYCTAFVNHAATTSVLLKNFDLMITNGLYNDCAFGVAGILDIPVVLFNTPGPLPWTSTALGFHEPRSFVPFVYTPYSDRMTFVERFWNMYTASMVSWNRDRKLVGPMTEIWLGAHADGQRLHLDKIARENVALVLSNSHFTVEWPTPAFPNVVDVGGLHCLRRSASRNNSVQLPQDLTEFIAAKKGFLVFSLGTSSLDRQMPLELQAELTAAFQSLPRDIGLIMKGPAANSKSHESWRELGNVHISAWLPQEELLGHEKCLGFITHGGRSSTIEAVCRGVPIVGMPFWVDQWHTLRRLEEAGMAIVLRARDSASISAAVHELLNDSARYKTAAMDLRRIFLDRPSHPMDLAIHWIEFVARNRHQLWLLKSAAQRLSWFEYHNLDIAVVILAIAAVVVCVVLSLVRRTCRTMKHFVRARESVEGRGCVLAKKTD